MFRSRRNTEVSEERAHLSMDRFIVLVAGWLACSELTLAVSSGLSTCSHSTSKAAMAWSPNGVGR